MKVEFVSLMEALEYLSKSKKHVPFILRGKTIEHPKTQEQYLLSDVSFIKSYKFEEDSDADHVSLLHVVKTVNGVEGYFIDSPGAYSNMEL